MVGHYRNTNALGSAQDDLFKRDILVSFIIEVEGQESLAQSQHHELFAMEWDGGKIIDGTECFLVCIWMFLLQREIFTNFAKSLAWWLQLAGFLPLLLSRIIDRIRYPPLPHK